MKLTGEDRRTWGKTCPSATLSTTNPTWTDPGSNPGLRSGRLAANRLSHGTAGHLDFTRSIFIEPSSLKADRNSVSPEIPQFFCKQGLETKTIPASHNLARIIRYKQRISLLHLCHYSVLDVVTCNKISLPKFIVCSVRGLVSLVIPFDIDLLLYAYGDASASFIQRCPVRISAGTSAISTDSCRCFLQYFYNKYESTHDYFDPLSGTVYKDFYNI
jgi:hypothetical protein